MIEYAVIFLLLGLGLPSFLFETHRRNATTHLDKLAQYIDRVNGDLTAEVVSLSDAVAEHRRELHAQKIHGQALTDSYQRLSQAQLQLGELIGVEPTIQKPPGPRVYWQLKEKQ